MRRSSSLTDTESAGLAKLVRHMSRGMSQSLQGSLLSLTGSNSHLPGAASKPGSKSAPEAPITDRCVRLLVCGVGRADDRLV